jgi:hypothetical protein
VYSDKDIITALQKAHKEHKVASSNVSTVLHHFNDKKNSKKWVELLKEISGELNKEGLK